jgi:hypothetical protein
LAAVALRSLPILRRLAARLVAPDAQRRSGLLHRIARTREHARTHLAHELVFRIGARQRATDHCPDRDRRRTDRQRPLLQLPMERPLDALRAGLRTVRERGCTVGNCVGGLAYAFGSGVSDIGRHPGCALEQVASGVRHSVQALSDGAARLLVAWPSAAPIWPTVSPTRDPIGCLRSPRLRRCPNILEPETKRIGSGS